MQTMLNCFTQSLEGKITPIIPVIEQKLDAWTSQQDERTKNYLQAIGFRAKPGAIGLVCDERGHLEKVLVGMSETRDCMIFGQLASSLPRGPYQVDTTMMDANMRYQLFLAWGMGSYQFLPYKKLPPLEAKLVLPKDTVNEVYLEAVLRATYLVRDLINTPADDMTPADLAEASVNLA